RSTKNDIPAGWSPAGISLASLPSGRQRLRIERRALLRAWLRARPSEAVTAIDVNVGDAFTASFPRTGPRVPLPRARALTGICLSGDTIGRRTRARGVDGSSAVGSTGRSTVGPDGYSVETGHRLEQDCRLEEGYRLEEPESHTEHAPP